MSETTLTPGAALYSALAGSRVIPEQPNWELGCNKAKRDIQRNLDSEMIHRPGYYTNFSATMMGILRYGEVDKLTRLGLQEYHRQLLRVLEQADNVLRAKMTPQTKNKLETSLSKTVHNALQPRAEF